MKRKGKKGKSRSPLTNTKKLELIKEGKRSGGSSLLVNKSKFQPFSNKTHEKIC